MKDDDEDMEEVDEAGPFTPSPRSHPLIPLPPHRLVSNSRHLIQFVTELEMMKRRKISAPLRARGSVVRKGAPFNVKRMLVGGGVVSERRGSGTEV